MLEPGEYCDNEGNVVVTVSELHATLKELDLGCCCEPPPLYGNPLFWVAAILVFMLGMKTCDWIGRGRRL